MEVMILVNWNTTNVTNIDAMFAQATSFNRNINTKIAGTPGSQYLAWDTKNVTRMQNVFGGNINWNKTIDKWNTSNVKFMNYMFSGATSFNLSLRMNAASFTVNGTNVEYKAWNTSNVTNMTSMFQNSTIFNQDIGNWDTTSLEKTRRMFYFATSFNNGASGGASANMHTRGDSINWTSGTVVTHEVWNMSLITDATEMFRNATDFDQKMPNWAVNPTGNGSFNRMFLGAYQTTQVNGDWTVFVSQISRTEWMMK